MNPDEKTIPAAPMPFLPGDEMTRAEFTLRRAVATHIRNRPSPLELPLFSAATLSPNSLLTPTGFSEPAGSPGETPVPVALQSGRDGRGVLLIPRPSSHKLIDLALHRTRSCEAPLSSGEQGVLLYILDRAAGDWRRQTGIPFSIRGILHDTAQVPDYLGEAPKLAVNLHLTGARVDERLTLLLGQASPASVPKPFAEQMTKARSWPMDLRIHIGWTALDPADTENINVGDCISLDAAALPGGGPSSKPGPHVRLSNQGFQRPARWISPTSLKIVNDDARPTERPPMTEDTVKEISAPYRSPELDAPAETAPMTVDVQVEMGRATMSLGDATGLVAGDVISLDRPADGTVLLTVGQKTIAKGTLVRVEGVLAVEITEVP